jgi:hypothetical protein
LLKTVVPGLAEVATNQAIENSGLAEVATNQVEKCQASLRTKRGPSLAAST